LNVDGCTVSQKLPCGAECAVLYRTSLRYPLRSTGMIQRDSDSQLRLTTAMVQGVHVLTISGDVDISVKTEFRGALEKAVAGANSPLVIDLSRARYFDAGAFSSLIAAQKEMTARADKLYIVVTRPIIRRLLSILNLDAFFNLYLSARDAITAAVTAESTIPTRASAED